MKSHNLYTALLVATNCPPFSPLSIPEASSVDLLDTPISVFSRKF